MGQKIRIALLQMSSKLGDIDANIKKCESLISTELDDNVDVLILPEVWTVGWDCTQFIKYAQPINNNIACDVLSEIAKTKNINIIGGSIITKEAGKYYNTCPVFDRNGKLVTTYNKMHLYSYYGCNEGEYITSGSNPVMAKLDGINYGLTICYDIRFPEIYRAYAKCGADILVNCAAWGSKKPIPWEVMTKSRAAENQSYMIALTQTGKIKNDEYNLGVSRIIDYKGEELCSITLREGIISSDVNLQEMYEFRAKAPTLKDIRDNYEVKILCENY